MSLTETVWKLVPAKPSDSSNKASIWISLDILKQMRKKKTKDGRDKYQLSFKVTRYTIYKHILIIIYYIPKMLQNRNVL